MGQLSSGEVGVRFHSVNVERRSDGEFSLLPVGGAVLPEEPIRYSSSGGALGSQVKLTVLNEAGRIVFEDSTKYNLSGNAWVDTVAPQIAGRYKLRASTSIFFVSHSKETVFVVSLDAPPPPPPPGNGGFFDLKKLTLPLLFLGGAILVAMLLRRRS
mgnify:CR=1 FL=1